MTYDQAQDLIERHAEDNGQTALQEWLELEYETRGVCEACGEGCDYPPVCAECAADAEAAKAHREGRE